jgi:hypothetical protein
MLSGVLTCCEGNQLDNKCRLHRQDDSGALSFVESAIEDVD